MKYIKKVGITPLPEEATASIIDGINIMDKTTNTYSARIIDDILSGQGGWKEASTNKEFIGSGTIKYIKIGKIVIVYFFDLQIIKDFPVNETLVAYGLPAANSTVIFIANGRDLQNSDSIRLIIKQNSSEIKSWFDNKQATSSEMLYYGQVIYMTVD